MKQEPVLLTTRISEVIVYPDRARISRSAEYSIPAGESILLVIDDHIPVSQSGDISVHSVQYSTPPKSVNKETGEVVWSLVLPKNGKKELTLEFTVEAPESKVIVGL